MTETSKKTPEQLEKEAEERLAKNKHYWEGFPEAPASDSVKWIDTQGFEHLTTCRAWTVTNLIEIVGKLQAAILANDGKPVSNQPKPAPTATKVQERDDTGTPVIDGDGKPVMIDLPKGVHVYTVKALFHDKNKDKTKDILKVVTLEEPYNTKYGVSCFHGGPDGWKAWPVGTENKYAPTAKFAKVVIRDPEGDSKYADVLEFRE